MKFSEGNYFNIDRRLTLTLALLIALILGGNGLIVLQFERTRIQTDRLTGVSQQLIAVLRLQEGLLSFHQRLNELAESRDAARLIAEAAPIRSTLLEQTRQIRSALGYLPSDFKLGPAFVTALNTIEITLPAQLDDISAMASVGDWEAVRLRLDNELKRMEATTSALVKSIDRDLDEELPRVVANTRDVQRRIFFIVPVTAISTVFVAAFFGWAIARRMLELRLEERVSERTRIARDLHDTLLQSFQGVLMKFSAVTYQLPDRPDEARRTLETVIDQARRALIEGRDAVQGLRSSTTLTNDLALAIRIFGEELAASHSGERIPAFRVKVEGAARDLFPLVRDEAHRIACEALRNAFTHAGAGSIEVEIQYAKRRLRLLVRDDGSGIDPQILREGGRAGHHGLPGLRERAKLVGGRLSIRSELNAGTEIELSVSGAAAFGRQSAPSRSRL